MFHFPRAYEALAGHRQTQFANNKKKLDKLLTLIAAGAALVVVELALWLALLASR